MISKIFSLRNYVMKQIMKPNKQGIMQIPDKGKVDFGEMIIKENLFKKGIDPKAITSEKQLDNILNTPNVAPKVIPKKSGEVINVDFDKGRWKDIDPEKKAGGGIAGMLGERDGYYKGSMAKSRPKKERRSVDPSWMMERMEPRGYRKVYESLEDIPEEALALMKKDPNFDLQTFLETVKWSEPEETRFKKIKKYGKYSDDDIPWGTASPSGQYLNYLPFGEKESIGDGLLSIKTPSDMDKVSTVMHEMRHSKMKEPWFAKSSAVPKWVQKSEEKNLPHYLDKDIKDKHSQYRDTQQDVSGEELYTRFLDQHFYPDAAKKGELAGSDYEPYFDKILKDKWASNLKAYKDILKEEKRVKSKPYGLAGGGKASSGLNYLLGEDDQNSRVPFGEGSSWDQFQKDKAYRLWEEYQQYLRNREKEKNQQPYIDERMGTGPGPVLEAADGGRIGLKDGTKFDPKRRGFLKVAAGLATLPFIGKYFKWAKPLAKSSKVLTQVPIKDISGMPAWFKPLVNKVIKEGDDVSKRFATQERQIVHKTELPDSKTDVIVTQDLTTGNVSVDVGMGKHGWADGHFGQPVRLEYKASEEIEPVINSWTGKVDTKGTKTKEEFNVEEAEFTGGHPENVKFEETSIEKFGEHGSDFSEVEKFATGTVSKKSKSVGTKEGFRDPDYASGGRVPYFAGDIVDPEGYNISRREMGILANADPSMREMIREFLTSRRKHKPVHLDRILDINRGRRTGEASGGRVPLDVGGWLKKKIKPYTKEGRDEFKKEWLDRKDLDMTVEEWNALPLKEKIKIRHREGNAQGGLAGMLGE